MSDLSDRCDPRDLSEIFRVRELLRGAGTGEFCALCAFLENSEKTP